MFVHIHVCVDMFVHMYHVNHSCQTCVLCVVSDHVQRFAYCMGVYMEGGVGNKGLKIKCWLQ